MTANIEEGKYGGGERERCVYGDIKCFGMIVWSSGAVEQ